MSQDQSIVKGEGSDGEKAGTKAYLSLNKTVVGRGRNGTSHTRASQLVFNSCLHYFCPPYSLLRVFYQYTTVKAFSTPLRFLLTDGCPETQHT
jgi:hypothetical protein